MTLKYIFILLISIFGLMANFQIFAVETTKLNPIEKFYVKKI